MEGSEHDSVSKFCPESVSLLLAPSSHTRTSYDFIEENILSQKNRRSMKTSYTTVNDHTEDQVCKLEIWRDVVMLSCGCFVAKHRFGDNLH